MKKRICHEADEEANNSNANRYNANGGGAEKKARSEPIEPIKGKNEKSNSSDSGKCLLPKGARPPRIGNSYQVSALPSPIKCTLSPKKE